jgi:hypothetical protein
MKVTTDNPKDPTATRLGTKLVNWIGMNQVKTALALTALIVMGTLVTMKDKVVDLFNGSGDPPMAQQTEEVPLTLTENPFLEGESLRVELTPDLPCDTVSTPKGDVVICLLPESEEKKE